MRFKMRQLRRIVLLVSMCATLLVFPGVTPVLAMEHGHLHGFHGRIVPAYPAYVWNWGYGWGWGGPFWDNYWPYYYPSTGKIKLENVSKTDDVLINGATVGEAKDNKTIRLKPGTYQVTVRNNGKDVINKNVMVIRGKTLKLEVGDQDGSLKFKDADKMDNVYINGRNRGDINDIDHFRLRPGSYQVTVMNHGAEVFNQHVTVLTGKTLTLRVGDRG